MFFFFKLLADSSCACISFTIIKIKKQQCPTLIVHYYVPGLLDILPHLILPITLTKFFFKFLHFIAKEMGS